MRVRCTGLVVALVACGGRDDVPAHPDDTEHTDVVDTVPGDSGVVDDSALDPVDSGGPGLPDSGPSAPYDTSPRFDSDDTDCVVGETAVDSGLAATWDGRVARASAFDAVNHACVHTAWRCTDTSGRALRLAVWARDPHVTRYYDAATGDLVATHLERPHACFGRGDAWIGEKIVGCVPVDEELVGCDTDALCPEPSGAACDSATDCWSPPLIPPVDDGEPCATWPAGDGTLARAAASPLLDVTLAGNVPQVRGVGDVTGDGVDDVLLSNPAYYGPTEPPYLVFAGGPGVLDGPLDPADAIASVDPGFYPWWQNANRGAGDVDGDGVNDLVFLDNGTGEPVVFLGPLVGALDPSDAVTVLVAGGVEHALDVVGDLDGDGDEEIVGVGDVGGTPSLRVLHVDAWVGSRVAATPDDWVAGPGLWWQQPVPHRVGDVDGDGAVDLVFSIPVAGQDADLALVPGPLPPGSGRSLWTVSRRALLRTPLQLVHAVSAADLDLDGDQEVLVHRMAWDQGYYVDPEIDVLDGPWSGSTPVEDLALARIVPGAEVDPRAVVAPGDLDGDGIPDLLVGASGASVARPCTLRPEQPWREASVHPGAILFLPGPVEGLHVLALERALWGPYRTAWVGAEVADVGDVEPGGSHEVVATAWPTYARDVLLRVPTCAR